MDQIGRSVRVLGGLVVGLGTPLVVAAAVSDPTQHVVPMVPMLFGVVIATLLGRLWVGLASAFVSAGVLYVLVFPPRHGLHAPSGDDIASLALFAVTAVTFSILLDHLVRRVAREAAERGATQAALAAEQTLVAQLQSALVPASLPHIDGIDLGVRYLPAAGRARVGGDWYVVVPLDEARVAIAVGDVAGHGIDAVTVMTQLRYAASAIASIDACPSVVMARLNELLLALQPSTVASAVVGVVDVRRRTWMQSLAGHPPPAMCAADGTVSLLEVGGGPLLGATADVSFKDEEVPLAPGSVLVLYSDGLVERRDEAIDTGIARLAAQMHNVDAELDRFCDRIVRVLEHDDGVDDVTVLALRLEGDRAARSDEQRARHARPRGLASLA